MATPLADAIFFMALVAIVVSQVIILRSTKRGMRHAGIVRGATLEWAFALLPAVALIALLAATWRTMHPVNTKVEGVTPSIEGSRT